jgi:hypothetical protein
MRTTLYEKMFIDGFEKPSYVVATITLERPVPEVELAAAIRATLERHPRLRSNVTLRFGVPVALVPRSPEAWLVRPGIRALEEADIHALEEELLGTPLDLRDSLPLEVYAVARPPALVIKVHHAMIDASSGFEVLHDFARFLEGRIPGDRSRRRAAGRAQAWTRWASRARLAPRLPGIGVTARYRPERPLPHERVAYSERVLPRAHALLTRRARAVGATFFELVASAVLSAMHAYNARSARPPERVGLMFARARPRESGSDAGFRAETRSVSIAAAQLATPHHPATLRELRRAGADPGHDDLALAALYLVRKLRRSSPEPCEQRGLLFTLSDLTSFGRALRPAADAALPIRDVRVLASPTSFDHAGMLVSRLGDDVRLALVAHRGAVDAGILLDATLARLEET